MIKFTILLRRSPSMTHDAFVDYHRNQHAGLFSALPEVKHHVRRYVQCHSLPADLPGLPPMTFDASRNSGSTTWPACRPCSARNAT